jgi:hypothetical protein
VDRIINSKIILSRINKHYHRRLYSTIFTMTSNALTESLFFIETADDDDNVAVVSLVQKSLVEIDKYDQLSQLVTDWKITMIDDAEYDGDDEDKKVTTSTIKAL